MRSVSCMSAIVAVLLLAGCGQRGALYLPTVPPLPPAPSAQTNGTGTSGLTLDNTIAPSHATAASAASAP
jgi:predicted small lipoprotein YifL